MRSLACTLLLCGCGSDTRQPVDEVAPARHVDLPTDMIAPVGVALSPTSTDRFVFDERAGLFRIDADGITSAVLPMSAMPTPDVPVVPPYTDIAAVAPNVFVLTAIGDGYLLDVSAMTLRQHFCYVPDGTPEDLKQRTDAVAYDAESDRVFAQPVTRNAQDVYQYSSVAGYERDTGRLVMWEGTNDDVAATGMSVIPGYDVVFGQGSTLSHFDWLSQQTTKLADLARFGVVSIDGLAFDAGAKRLVVVDRVSMSLFEIDLDAVVK